MRPSWAIAATGAFTAIDRPVATATLASGINRGGQIVGFFQDEDGKTHGYVRSANGGSTAIDAPGATATYAFGIADGSQIVGDFEDAGGRRHGFVITR